MWSVDLALRLTRLFFFWFCLPLDLHLMVSNCCLNTCYSHTLELWEQIHGEQRSLERSLLCWSNPFSIGEVGVINPPQHHINALMGHHGLNPNLGRISYPLLSKGPISSSILHTVKHSLLAHISVHVLLAHVPYCAPYWAHTLKRLMCVPLTHTRPCSRWSTLKPYVTLHSPNDTKHTRSMRPWLACDHAREGWLWYHL